MPLDPVIAATLARAARRQQLQSAVDRHRGAVDGTANLARNVAEQNQAARDRHDAAKQALESHDAGNDATVDKFGYRSALDDTLLQERITGKTALVEYVKKFPTCTEVEALQAWRKACPQPLLQDCAALLTYYRSQLVRRAAIPEASWEMHRQWILGAPLEQAIGG